MESLNSTAGNIAVYSYPPTALTSNPFIISDAQGAGTYVVSFSSSYSSEPYPAKYAFDRSSSTFYHFDVTYSEYYGVYQGTVTTTTTNGTIISRIKVAQIIFS